MSVGFVGVAGLPRAGSTLLCQLLAEHPQIYSEGNSLPLCSILLRRCRGISDNDFFLSQLDTNFDRAYGRAAGQCR
jgi:sulfotransferase